MFSCGAFGDLPPLQRVRRSVIVLPEKRQLIPADLGPHSATLSLLILKYLEHWVKTSQDIGLAASRT